MGAPRQSEADRRILGAASFGVISRTQLLGMGLSCHAIEWRRVTGRLLPVCDGVYAVGRPAGGEKAAWMAALLATGRGSVLAGRSAGAIHGILRWSGTVEVVRRHSRKPSTFVLRPPGLARPRQVRVRRSARIASCDLVTIRDVPATSVERTLLDLAGALSEVRLRAAFNEADRRGLLREDQLRTCSDQSRGRPGGALFRWLAQTRHPETAQSESELEAMFLRLCEEAGLPLPKANRPLLEYRVDCLWPDQRLVVELDGYEFHRGRMAFERDARRDNRLKRAGFQVLRFTYDMVGQSPDEVVALVSHELKAHTRAPAVRQS